MSEIDPYDTLMRLIRGTTYDTADHQVNKAKGLSPFSAVAAAAYNRMGGRRQEEPPQRRPKPEAPRPSLDDEEPVQFGFHAADARLIIRTMIAAMAAAGEDEAHERQRILAYLHESGGTAGQVAFAEHEMRHPASAEDIAAGVASRETAVEIYAAALLATQAANVPARSFLARLAVALKLEPDFVRQLHASWDDPPP